MSDDFSTFRESLDSPAGNAAAITPSNTTNLTKVTRGIYIGVAGTVRVITAAGQTVSFVGAAAGTVIPVRAARVTATGTTATNLVALW